MKTWKSDQPSICLLDDLLEKLMQMRKDGSTHVGVIVSSADGSHGYLCDELVVDYAMMNQNSTAILVVHVDDELVAYPTDEESEEVTGNG